jgi:hypothetical protein
MFFVRANETNRSIDICCLPFLLYEYTHGVWVNNPPPCLDVLAYSDYLLQTGITQSAKGFIQIQAALSASVR